MNKWIICTGPDWFRPSVTSTRQIINHFRSDGYKVLWVNPIAFKSPAVNSDNRKSMFRKIVNKAKTHAKLFKKVDKDTYVLIPVYIPVFNSVFDNLNNKLIVLQMRLASGLLGINWQKSILWISGNFTLSPLLKYNFSKKIYQAADLISDFRTNDKSLLTKLQEKEVHLSRNVNVRFASSPNIKKKLEKLTQTEVHLLTHGVNYRHFVNPAELDPYIINIQKKGRPIAGYFGTLSDANDKTVFRKLAENGFSVVIIGKVLGDYTGLQGVENIYFAGPVDFEKLPRYARGFDVCLLNWVMADWIKNSFPVKTLEYLAMGKPVVSCRIPVVEELFGQMIYFADTPDEFVAQAKKSLLENNDIKRSQRIKEAAKHTWDEKFREIKALIQ